MDKKDLENRFNYHAPNKTKQVMHASVRDVLVRIAILWDGDLPEGREKSLAMTKLEEAMFWANAAIARNEIEDIYPEDK